MAEHRGRVLLVLCQSLHSGGPCAPKKAPATQNQEVAMHLTTCWAQGSSAWQLASLQEEGTGRSRWLQQCAGLGGARPPPPPLHFHFLPRTARESKAGAECLRFHPLCQAHFQSTRELLLKEINYSTS